MNRINKVFKQIPVFRSYSLKYDVIQQSSQRLYQPMKHAWHKF